jgi:hypothetical protein
MSRCSSWKTGGVSRLLLVSLASALGIGWFNDAGAVVRRDQEPTSIAKQAKNLGITKTGPKYKFRNQKRTTRTLKLTVAVPTAWSATADSHFVRPGTNQTYGVGLRATTNADKFHNSFDVPGMKITADGVTPQQAAAFDGRDLVANNGFKGCRSGSLRPYDNGTWQGVYQMYDRCGHNRAAAVVVAAQDGTAIILLAAQVLTKADCKAIDKILETATVAKTSV